MIYLKVNLPFKYDKCITLFIRPSVSLFPLHYVTCLQLVLVASKFQSKHSLAINVGAESFISCFITHKTVHCQTVKIINHFLNGFCNKLNQCEFVYCS